ncbi:DUF115 domain-containing protein [Leclercia sp. EC_58]|uniref:6-hydroxymethylpterin diphosphokinase MptE-like protein n=1 Tax=Leclercia sp. EC_58 TaxID=2584090 RepID=UPI001C708A3F|nr:6-hydroxymethylpterin diphosphokinase MptE-like protein [Leclercia sp. EC_58]MBW9399805.1 DUF115 domain-containing protein [Leclercia sp. EC_58]
MKISNLKNIENGKDIYIVANGPSVLNKKTLNLLSDKIVIGMNATPLLCHEYSFDLKYYTVSDERFIKDVEKYKIATEIISKSTVRVFRSELKKHDSPVLIDETYYINAIGRDGFSFNLSQGFYFGCTTTMFSIQLAAYLGAKNIYLLGVDLSYPKDKPRFYKEKNPAPIDNFTCVQIKNIRDAYHQLRKRGVNLYNCSNQSLLKPYIPYFAI